MATGGALLQLGDRDAAMQRFSRALDIPKRRPHRGASGDGAGIHAAGSLSMKRRRQIALGFAEARLTIPR